MFRGDLARIYRETFGLEKGTKVDPLLDALKAISITPAKITRADRSRQPGPPTLRLFLLNGSVQGEVHLNQHLVVVKDTRGDARLSKRCVHQGG